MPRRFLTAEWRHLAMLNYEIDAACLTTLVPHGSELDSWNGRSYVSMVGFLFLDTRVLGIPIPFHRNFEEVNLRFYVRSKAEDGWRRGVVFVKEIVPRAAIAFVARVLYGEKYVALPMSHRIDASVAYEWTFEGRTQRLSLTPGGPPQPLVAGTEEEFITEHTGAIPPNATAAHRSTASTIRRGAWRLRRRRGSSAMPRGCTGLRSPML